MLNALKKIGVVFMAILLTTTMGCVGGNDDKNTQVEMLTDSPLSNTYKLLTNKKKLTIGYLVLRRGISAKAGPI